MIARHKLLHTTRRVWLFFIALSLITSTIVFSNEPAEAAVMQMKTGYYLGTGLSIAVTGMGFQPNLVMVKSSASTAGVVFATSTMPTTNTAHFSAAANDTGSNLVLNSNGFTVGTGLAIINNVNVLTRWVAYGGSDCTSTGNFCVGTYTGNGNTGSRLLPTGFQPNIAIVKRSTAIAGHFRTATMPANRTEYFTSTAADTAGGFIASFALTGVNVGTSDNANTAVYTFIAFKSGSGVAEGSYAGDAVDNKQITGLGFLPAAVFIKNSSSATANSRRAVFSTRNHFDDHASYASDAVADAVNIIQVLESNAFRVGSSVLTNETGVTMYWFAIGNENAPQATGSFNLEEGVYTGTGVGSSVTGLPFAPDLVLIKADGATGLVGRSRLMNGNNTAHFGASTGAFTGGVVSLDTGGFTVGTAVEVNSAGVTYRWQAFGNAYSPVTQTGATDFAIGVYLGNAVDNRNITGLPFQPDLVFGRSVNLVTSKFRTSAFAGDLSAPFDAGSDTANVYQQFNSNGFQVGSGTDANGASVLQYWIAFKAGNGMRVGSYTGNGVDSTFQPLTSFRPNLLWVKSPSLTAISRPSSITTDSTQLFSPAANIIGGIKQLNGGGFTVGTSTSTNANTSLYRYVAWRKTLPETLTSDFVNSGTGVPLASPVIAFNTAQTSFACNQSVGIFGNSPEVFRVTNKRIGAAWSTSIAATGGPTAKWLDSGSSRDYDYNDVTGSGCGDGGDADTISGQLTVEAAGGTAGPETLCKTTNVSMGSNQTFSQGVVDAITLASASIGADTNCYWDVTNVNLTQTIPFEQLPGNYEINLTVTTVAS
jgi:hypothetical protein